MQPFVRSQVGQLVRRVQPMRMVIHHKTGKTDAWRSHPIFDTKENMKPQNMFPGLIPAIGLFAVYVVIDKATGMSNKSHDHGHH